MEMRRFPLGMLWTNCYLIWDKNKNGVVVDPGGPTAKVEEFIKDKDIKLQWVLLTHGHGDHIGGLNQIRAKAKNGVAIHKADLPLLGNPALNFSNAWSGGITSADAEKLLEDGDRLTVGDLEISVIATPGHTRGGVCYLIEEDGQKILMSGDTLFAGSIGRTDLDGGNEYQLIESLSKLALLDDSIPVYPGHGPASTIKRERMFNPFWPR